MATTTITDLPASRALDYQAMSAIRGAGGAPWIFGAFVPFQPASAQVETEVGQRVELALRQGHLHQPLHGLTGLANISGQHFRCLGC